MLIKKSGRIISFTCPFCDCVFSAGVNEARLSDKGGDKGRMFYCKCPCCDNECRAESPWPYDRDAVKELFEGLLKTGGVEQNEVALGKEEA